MTSTPSTRTQPYHGVCLPRALALTGTHARLPINDHDDGI